MSCVELIACVSALSASPMFCDPELLMSCRTFMSMDVTVWMPPTFKAYGIHTFDSGVACALVAMAKPAAIVANCAHPARMVFGPGGL